MPSPPSLTACKNKARLYRRAKALRLFAPCLFVSDKRLGLLDHLRRNFGHSVHLRAMLGGILEQLFLSLPTGYEIAVRSHVPTRHVRGGSLSQI